MTALRVNEKTIVKRRIFLYIIFSGPSGKQGQPGIAGRPGDKGPPGEIKFVKFEETNYSNFEFQVNKEMSVILGLLVYLGLKDNLDKLV